MTLKKGLGRRRRRTFELLLPYILGLPDSDAPRVKEAVDRLDDFVMAQRTELAAGQVRQMFDLVHIISVAEHLRLPGGLNDRDRETLFDSLFDGDTSRLEAILQGAGKAFGADFTVHDIARGLREMACLAYYSNPRNHAFTGYVPPWRRKSVLVEDPTLKQRAPYTRKSRVRLNLTAIDRKQRERTPPVANSTNGWFSNNGKPRIAIIGSGCGGAVAAAQLAADFDVAVFEAGAGFHAQQMPLDSMSSMSLLYRRGLMTPTKDLDVRLLLARVLGGGSAVNEGVTVRPRKNTLDHWVRKGAGIDLAALDKALADTEARQRFMPYAREMMTGPTLRFEKGCQAMPEILVQQLRGDLGTQLAQHSNQPHVFTDRRGAKCLGCGRCNHGCHFGHHLSVDRTFLRDAQKAGAHVHTNIEIERLLSKKAADGSVRITGLCLAKASGGQRIPVDGVLLAAGAVGSPTLMLRSARGASPLDSLPGMKEKLFGKGLGVNYGTPVVARWRDRPKVPGTVGLQVGFIATKPGDETFIIENGHISPGIMASLVPGIGAQHRRLMARFPHLGMAVNTIGGPQTGRVSAKGEVNLKVGGNEMAVVHETLATMVQIYLHTGAEEVGFSGLRGLDDGEGRFDQSWLGKEREVTERIARLAPTAEQLALASSHVQGGMRMNDDPALGAVRSDFRVHGVDNLFVGDASLFPSTITVNPQWLVMSLGMMAGRSAAKHFAARPSVRA